MRKGIGPIPDVILVFSLIIVISVSSIYLVKGYGISLVDSSDSPEEMDNSSLAFVEENYEFSITYPSDWEFQPYYYSDKMKIKIEENSSGMSDPVAFVQIKAGKLDEAILVENIPSEIEKLDNQGEITLVSKPRETEIANAEGFDYEFIMPATTAVGRENFRFRQLRIDWDNKNYRVSTVVVENFHDNYWATLENIHESFELRNN